MKEPQGYSSRKSGPGTRGFSLRWNFIGILLHPGMETLLNPSPIISAVEQLHWFALVCLGKESVLPCLVEVPMNRSQNSWPLSTINVGRSHSFLTSIIRVACPL